MPALFILGPPILFTMTFLCFLAFWNVAKSRKIILSVAFVLAHFTTWFVLWPLIGDNLPDSYLAGVGALLALPTAVWVAGACVFGPRKP